MKIFTSRYQNAELIRVSGAVPVRITRGHPRWKLPYTLGGKIPELAPPREVFAIRYEETFENAYIAHLESVGLDRIRLLLEAMSGAHHGTDLVMLCFEDVELLGEKACHRRIFAHWWENVTGQVVEELASAQPRLTL